MQVTENRLTHWLALLLTLAGLLLCGTSTGLAAEKRVWKGNNGSSFEGHFLTVDQKTGDYVFMDVHDKFIQISPDNLTDESRGYVMEHLKKQAETSDRNKRPRATAVNNLVFTKPASCARDWTNSKGKTVNGTILSTTREAMQLEVRGQPATVRLSDLQEEDRTAVLLWTGTTNDPLSFPGGTFQYTVSCDGEELLSFSIELTGNLSRTILEYTDVAIGVTPSGEQRRVVTAMKKRLTTDHSSGAFETAQWMKNKGWVKTAIGQWHPLDHLEATAPAPRRADWLRRVLPELEVTAAGAWLARRLVLEDKSDPNQLFNDWIKSNPLALVRFTNSHLPAALRLVLESPTVADTGTPDPSLVAPKPSRVLPVSTSVLRFPPMDGMLGALQLHDLAPVAWSFVISKDRASKRIKAGQYLVALKNIDFTLPEASGFEIDPRAAGMAEGSYKDCRERRKAR